MPDVCGNAHIGPECDRWSRGVIPRDRRRCCPHGGREKNAPHVVHLARRAVGRELKNILQV